MSMTAACCGCSEAAKPSACPAEVARGISRALQNLMDGARDAGLNSLADALEVARVEAERDAGSQLWGRLASEG